MIKQIEINYPWFWSKWLELTKEFTEWINIIEENNWYWKTTILNTIMSVFTSKYPWLRTLPEWIATIITDSEKYVLSKKCWLWNTKESNDLYNYCMPWRFFEWLTTVQQRKVLVDLLWLDYDTFMKDLCEAAKPHFPYLDWSDSLESTLKAKMKEFETNETIILQDITRLKSQLINCVEKDFSDVAKFHSDQKIIEDLVKEYNKWILARQTNYNNSVRNKTNLQNEFTNFQNDIERIVTANINLENQLVTLRSDYTTANENASCDKCWSKLEWANKQILLDSIARNAATIKVQIENNQSKLKELDSSKKLTAMKLNTATAEVDAYDTNFEVLGYDDVIWNAKRFNIEFVWISEVRLQEYDDYNIQLNQKAFIEKELKVKEDNLKAIDTLKLQSNLDKLKEFKSMFTKKLELATKDIWLDIELFELQKNGNIKETFTINYNWVDYYNLSTWNKAIVNIKLAKLFVDKLWLHFILIDEASNIGKDNISLVKDLSKDYQIIAVKSTLWTAKDFK